MYENSHDITKLITENKKLVEGQLLAVDLVNGHLWFTTKITTKSKSGKEMNILIRTFKKIPTEQTNKILEILKG